MKTYSFVSILLIAFLVNSDCIARPDAVSAQHAEFMKAECKRMVRTYYDDIETLIAANLDAEDQRNVIDSIQYDCFRNADVLIDNSIPVVKQQNLKIRSYLTSITVLSSKIEEIRLNETTMAVSDIYYDEKEHYYYIVASVQQTIRIKEDDKSTQHNGYIDIYFSYNHTSKLKLKIFSIQLHKNDPLRGRKTVKIADADNDVSDRQPAPYFVFDVVPNTADVYIDRRSVFNDGGKIRTTPGVHSIQIAAQNYYPVDFDIEVPDTGAQRVVRTLTKKNGYLCVSTSQPNLNEADVYIDKYMAGNIPLLNYQLSVGAHQVEIKGHEGLYKTFRVMISEENTSKLNIEGNDKPKWNKERGTGYSPPSNDLSYHTFYNELSQYGKWVEDPRYGSIWVPNVPADFRPYYTNGHWAMTDEGNMWVSSEPWGWACYHYGRWAFDPYYNWVWIPGYEWAPAWVNWRIGSRYCGWAPIAPGLQIGVSNRCDDSWWIFVGADRIYSDSYSYSYAGDMNADYIRQTTVINNVYSSGKTRYYYGPSVTDIERRSRRSVKIYYVEHRGKPGAPSVHRHTISAYRPDLRNERSRYIRQPHVITPSRIIQNQRYVAPAAPQRTFRQDYAHTPVQQSGMGSSRTVNVQSMYHDRGRNVVEKRNQVPRENNNRPSRANNEGQHWPGSHTERGNNFGANQRRPGGYSERTNNSRTNQQRQPNYQNAQPQPSGAPPQRPNPSLRNGYRSAPQRQQQRPPQMTQGRNPAQNQNSMPATRNQGMPNAAPRQAPSTSRRR